MKGGRRPPGEPGRALDTTLLYPDPLDRAYAITVEREASATRQILASRLANLRRAAEKVGEGTYGRVTGLTGLGCGFGNLLVVKQHFHYVILAIIVLSVLPAVGEVLAGWRKARRCG